MGASAGISGGWPPFHLSVTLKMSELLALKQVLLRGFFVNSDCPCENKRMIL